MARLLLTIALATTLLIPAAAEANGTTSHGSHISRAPRRQASATAAPLPATNPLALSLKLAERYWHGIPACGTPTIVMSAEQLPNSDYEATTGPEPANSVVEMWTEVQKCT